MTTDDLIPVLRFLRAWMPHHAHTWTPGLLLVGVLVNGFAFAKRWPTTGQWMHLFACVCSLSGAASVWLEAARQDGSSASWGQVIGALCIVVITIESAAGVLKELTTRAPKPP